MLYAIPMYAVLAAIAVGLYIVAVDAAGWKGGLTVTIVYIAFAVYVSQPHT